MFNLDYVNDNSETIDVKSKLYNSIIGFVLDGKYEISMYYLKNNSIVNNYMLPYKDTYLSIQFLYHFKNIEKVPLEFKFGVRTIDSINNSFKSNSLIFGFYKEFPAGNYPIIPYANIYLLLDSKDNDDLKLDNQFNFGTQIKLIVDYSDNYIFG